MPTRRGGEGKRGFKWFEIYGGGGSPGGGRKEEEEEEIKHPLSSSLLLLLLPSQRPADAALVDEDSPTRKLSRIKWTNISKGKHIC